jgi:hypothetical protein
MTFNFRKLLLLIALGSGSAPGTCLPAAESTADPLWAGFQSPPDSARPRAWWHWMNGNITKEGIKLDLEWMRRVGLGGFQNFDAALDTPQVVKKRLAYMTPEWKEAFKYATVLADQLGLEEAIAGSPGWSESGGPWVPAAQAMKKYVWSETRVKGGKPFKERLRSPPTESGAFQNLPINDTTELPKGAKPIPQYYADSVVIAYRKPAGEASIDSLHAKMTANAGAPNFAMLTDGDLGTATKLPIPQTVGQGAWIQYEFPKAQAIHAMTIVVATPNEVQALIDGMGPPEIALQASADGQHFKQVVAFMPDSGSPEFTLAFAPVSARYFRVSFKRGSPPPAPYWSIGVDLTSLGIQISPAPTDYQISELVLHPGARVSRWEEKAAFVPLPDSTAPVPDFYAWPTPHLDASDTIAPSDIVDLTSKLRSDGSLDWTPPPGDWLVLRFGYSLLGVTNHPATAEATGLEVDKLDRRYVKQYFNTYLDSYLATVGATLMGKRGIQYVINDSWEAGSPNWTDNMIAQFKKRRGYDPVSWMPVLTGRVVGSAEASDKFLWDFRKTIADLIADEHYGQLEETLRERNMGHYGESHEAGRVLIADGMEMKKFNDVPMGAMWTQSPGVNKEQYGFNADDRESASVAHIYGQNIAAAESMSATAGPWAWSPATLKPTADQEFLNGINRIVIHESAHQPLVDKAPGMTLGPFGQWFNRNETWAEQAKPWIDYLARTSFLLQQGRFAADVVYFYGEDSNLTALFSNSAPVIPPGYGFDYINADGLIHEISAADNQITTPSGMTYRVLALGPHSRHMSLPVLRAIYKLVADGAVVAGLKPIDDPSLADDPAEFHKLSDELFGDGTGAHKVGKGIVYAGQDLGDVLQTISVAKDFDFNKREGAQNLLFVHRKLSDGDLYFVDNRSDRAETVEASFRVTGKAPELWRAEDGMSEQASFKIANGRTSVPLTLEPWGTVFVLFRRSTAESAHTVPAKFETNLATAAGEWKISFQPGRGAPASVTAPNLASWSQNSDPGVRYFSGIGTYTKTITASTSWFKKGAEIWLELGDVKNLAEVAVNGKPLGVVWHTPFRVNATTALKPGANELSIKVVNSWVNRLIGDQQPGVTTPITFADVKPYQADSLLLPSGLMGPVSLVSIAQPPSKPPDAGR